MANLNNLNEQYIFQAKEILRTIINSGLEGYIVGESLRDLVLDKEIKEVEIFTNLTIDKLMNLFKDYQIDKLDDSHIALKYLGYNFIISTATTYTLNSLNPKIKVNAPRRHYSTSLMDFLEQKLYSVNTLAMGINNVIYDCYNGRQDLYKKRLKMICDNPQAVFTSDPIRILEAIRLVSELGFHLDKNVYKAMKSKSKYLKDAPLEKVAKEIVKINEGKYAKKGIRLLVKTKAYKRLPYFKYEINRLYNNYRKEDNETLLAIGLVKAKTYQKEIGEATESEYFFQNLVNLAITNPKSNYDVFTLYANGLDKCLKANNINYILGKCNKKTHQITKAYNNLPIKKTCDLAFKGEDILKLTNSNDLDGDFMNQLVDNIIAKVLLKELPNDYQKIADFVNEEIKAHLEEVANANSISNIAENEIDTNVNNTNVNSINIGNSINISNTNSTDNNEKKEINNGNSNIDINNKDNDLNNNLNNFNNESNLSNNNNIAENANNGFGSEYEMLRKRQEELDKRVLELELQNLEKEIELETERKIKQSGLLDGLSGAFRESTYETLKKVYHDVLINSEKYEKLKNNGGKNE